MFNTNLLFNIELNLILMLQNKKAQNKILSIKKEPTQSVGSFRKRNYFATGPIIANMVPAATAVPITPATLGPIACMSKKLEGLAF